MIVTTDLQSHLFLCCILPNRLVCVGGPCEIIPPFHNILMIPPLGLCPKPFLPLVGCLAIRSLQYFSPRSFSASHHYLIMHTSFPQLSDSDLFGKIYSSYDHCVHHNWRCGPFSPSYNYGTVPLRLRPPQ